MLYYFANKASVVFTCGSIDSGVVLNLTTNSYSIVVVIDVSFILLFLVSILTCFSFVFSTFWIARTNVICDQLFKQQHINVIFHGIGYQHKLSDRGFLEVYKTL